MGRPIRNNTQLRLPASKYAAKRNVWRRLWLLLFCKHDSAYRILNGDNCWMAVCQVCGQVLWVDRDDKAIDHRDKIHYWA